MEFGSGGNAPNLGAGVRVERYELVAPIEIGVTSSVWVARQRGAGGLERLVAMRAIHVPLSDDSPLREALLKEVRLASGVAHPNVAQVLDFGEREDLIWVVSEWLDGNSLATLRDAVERKRQKIPAGIMLRILADACAGLHAAHLLRDRSEGLLNVVHGDVSARSVVVGANGVSRVIDLGVAKATARTSGAANPSWRDAVRGPLPPEGQRIDRHADVWAIGAILEQTLGPAATTAPPPPDAPPPVASIVRELSARAMSLDPAERFATAAEMQGAIEAAMIALGIPTTSANVAAFAAEHLADRAAARAEAIDAALVSLGPITAFTQPPTQDSISATAHTVHPPISPSSYGAPIEPPTATTEPARTTAPPDAVESQAAAGAPLAAEAPLGAARAAVSVPPPPRKTRAFAFAGGAVTMALIAGVVALVASRETSHSTQPAAAVSQTPLPPPSKPTCPGGTAEVPGGKFYMGSDNDLDLEKPAHHVILAPYCIDLFEVTVEQYRACSDAGHCKRAARENTWPGITAKDANVYDPLCNDRDPATRGKHPINCVDWQMAERYCEAQGERLPTEAEWEFAARGPDGRKFPWGDDEPGPIQLNACGKECVAWGKKNHVDLEPMYEGDDRWPTTAPVGSFPAGKSRYGLQDVVGNVWEWTSDWYAPYAADAAENPRGPSDGTERVIRGGAWNGAYPAWVRPTFRYHNDPAIRSYGVGFRCARSLTP